MNNQIFIDASHTRYSLVCDHPGKKYNWIFLPGGPGMSAEYMRPLATLLALPGKSWLMDLPANGDNISESVPEQYDFNLWMDSFVDGIRQFENPVLIGHSFGGMFPLLFPELENALRGFVILNSASKLWMEESARVVKERNLPSIEAGIAEMARNPCKETGTAALVDCAPYYFPESTLAEGKELLRAAEFNCHAALWWFQKVAEINYSARWIPQQVKTLVIGGEYDAITPHAIFEKDERFHRKNIHIQLIKGAGHLPWFEQPEATKKVFDEFVKELG